MILSGQICVRIVLVLALLLSGGIQFAQAEDNLLMVSVGNAGAAGNVRTVHAKVLIQAPPAIVWNTLTDYPLVSDIFPGYERSRVLQSRGSHKLVAVAMKVAAFLPTYKYQMQAYENAASYQLNMTRVSGDFKSLNATYKLTPQNNGTATLLTYRMNIDPGGSAPGIQGLIRANTEKSMKALERHTEQQYRKSQIGQR